MTTGTVTLHRVMHAPAERIYRALLDPAALCKWLPPTGFTCQGHSLDAREGGRDDHHHQVEPVSCGTQLDILQSGIPSAIAPADSHLGWQDSMGLLKLLFEPSIPG